MSVLRSHADADLPLFDHIHCVAFVTRAEQERAGLAINALEQFAQFACRIVIKRLKQRHMTQRLRIHLRQTDTTAVTITGMRAFEKPQLSPAVVVSSGKINLD